MFRLDEERNEPVESKPEEILEPEEDDSDIPDNELGAVVEFGEDELDEAQTEAEVKNITNKHHITIEELKREVLGSVRKKVFLTPSTLFILQYWACLHADVSYFLCCTRKRDLFRVQQRK